MKTIYELAVLFLVAITWLIIYQSYGDEIKNFFYSGEPTYVVQVSNISLEVTVADNDEERAQGLSGVTKLNDFEGKLFIFDEPGYPGIWMKDMMIPIDVLWFDDDLKLIHIQENLTPDTYPDVYVPPTLARFVIETNAYFVQSLKLELGSRLIVPPELLPVDIRDRLQQQ